MALFCDDAVWERPPFTGWYETPEMIGRLITNQCPANVHDDLQLVPSMANGQPAFGMSLSDEDGSYSAFQLHVLTLASTGISHVTAFFNLSLFATFALPESLPPAINPARPSLVG